MTFHNPNLRKRVITGCILAVVLCLMLGFSNYFWVTDLCISVLSVCGITELRNAVGRSWSKWFYRAMILIGLTISWISIPGYRELAGFAFCGSLA